MLQRFKVLILVLASTYSTLVFSSGFKITLYDGKFYGPGNLGVHEIEGGSLENFVVSSPMTGLVSFLNNGASPPNVDAENFHTGPVDGLLSDGSKINENVNAAFVLNVPEPETQQLVKLFVGSVSEEIVKPDDNDNLTFNLHAAFDTGFAADALRLPVQFITGAVTVPLSEKSKRGLGGGNDSAGPVVAGTTYVGRLGDMDQDGYLDGVFVLAGNTPFELLIAEGDPVLIVRPFKSDIPINAREASYYELNGIIKNYRTPMFEVMHVKDNKLLLEYLTDVDSRVQAVLNNFTRVRPKRGQELSETEWGSDLPNELSSASLIVNQLMSNSFASLNSEQLEAEISTIFGYINSVYERVRVLQKKT